jgi:DNA-binding IclR family transcriptional regulator
MRTERDNIEAVEKTVVVLEALRELDGAGVTELADHLNMAKATVYTHLATLRDCEFVVKDGGQYRISLRFLDFGEYAKGQTDVYGVMTDQVDMLAEESEEAAQFMVEEHGRGIYLYKGESSRAIQTASHTGSRRPLHCTALGKAILANLPDQRVEEIIDRHGLPQQTDATITDRDELLAALEEIREKGYALDDEEIQPGLRCVAVPVLDYDGDILGAVSVSGPTSRMQGERFREGIPEMVSNAANVIEINVRHV